jgi:SAM-dependent methyltransferase
MPPDACPICDAPAAARFLHRPSVPVHQNLLLPSADAARSVRRGELDMRACGSCGFVFNAAFDPELTEYGPEYENSQDHSPAFIGHLEELVDHLVRGRGVRDGLVVEVGCGKGVFLRKLLSHPDNRSEGVGFDPSYLGPEQDLGGRLRFVRDFYRPETAVRADVVVCRHVIEHVDDPLALLRTVRAAAGGRGVRVFFETPCVGWIFRHFVPWDFFYEHCSLFTSHSLGLALTRAGFAVSGVRHVFGGQYLWAEAATGPGDWPAGEGETARMAEAFSGREPRLATAWQALLEKWSDRGQVVVWGAGAKGVTFCNLADPQRRRVAGVVDVNPAKQGKYLAGTGHPILAPEQAAGAAAAVVLNPNYVAEVAGALSRLGSQAVVLDLTHLEAGHAPDR